MANAPRKYKPPGYRPQPAHQRGSTGWNHRGQSRQERGYGDDWNDGRGNGVRNEHLSEHPLCQPCLRRSVSIEAVEVDHIKPFKGRDDPLRLDRSNLESVCISCHRRNEARRRRGEQAGGMSDRQTGQ